MLTPISVRDAAVREPPTLAVACSFAPLTSVDAPWMVRRGSARSGHEADEVFSGSL